MDTKESIQQPYEQLQSREGRMAFLIKQTGFPRERIETMDRLGTPWPIRYPEGFEAIPRHIAALRRGEVCSEDGLNHRAALETYCHMLDLEREQVQALPNTPSHESTGPVPYQGDLDERVQLYLESVAQVANESFVTVLTFYSAYLGYLSHLRELKDHYLTLCIKEKEAMPPEETSRGDSPNVS